MKENAYDKYLAFQFGQSGNFYKLLFEMISVADDVNAAKLSVGFPFEVDAVHTWQRDGQEALLAKCTPGNPNIERMRLE